MLCGGRASMATVSKPCYPEAKANICSCLASKEHLRKSQSETQQAIEPRCKSRTSCSFLQQRCTATNLNLSNQRHGRLVQRTSRSCSCRSKGRSCSTLWTRSSLQIPSKSCPQSSGPWDKQNVTLVHCRMRELPQSCRACIGPAS